MINSLDTEFRSFFGRCQNPSIIENPYTHEKVLTSCGRCPNCIAIKTEKLSLMCNVHRSLYKYCYFVTLTYADKYIPKFRLVEQDESTLVRNTEYCDESIGSYNCVVDCSRLPEHGSTLMSYSFRDKDKELILDKCKLKGFIPFAYTPDLQRFLKRLRYYLTKTSANDFTYYAVSEYGPVHFRPHFHLLLFSNSVRFLKGFFSALYKSWKFGRIHYRLADNKVGRYLTDYVNSYTYLPTFFTCRDIKPKAVHSSYFASLLPRLDCYSLYADPYKYITETLYPLFGKYVPLPLFRSSFNKLLPKTIGFGKKNLHQLYYDYSAYTRVCSQLGMNLTPSQLARLFCDFACSENSFLVDDSVWGTFIPYIRYDLCRNDYSVYSDPDKVYDILYRYFKVSFDFFRYICDSDVRLYWSRVKTIKTYYDTCASIKMTDFYTLMDYYTREIDSDCSSFYYLNKFQNSTHDPLPSSHPDFLASLKANHFFQLANTHYTQYCSDKVKHKELNDRNGIFLNI